MKSLPWVLVVLLVLALAAVYFRPLEPRPAEIVRDTITQTDTIRDTVPIPSKVRPVRTDTVYLPVANDSVKGDSIKGDSVSVAIPITQKEYETEKYKAWVSGYRAKLDSIDVYDRTRTITEREIPRRKRFGLGLQVGYGLTGNKASPYIGIGISYDLFRW